MFEVLKKLWNKDPLAAEQPIVVKTNISEPVISFVNTVKKDPKRFVIKKELMDIYLHSQGTPYKYSVTDKVANKYFSCSVRVCWESFYTKPSCLSFGYKTYIYTKPEPWLTDEEVLYVIKELEDFFKEKVEYINNK